MHLVAGKGWGAWFKRIWGMYSQQEEMRYGHLLVNVMVKTLDLIYNWPFAVTIPMLVDLWLYLLPISYPSNSAVSSAHILLVCTVLSLLSAQGTFVSQLYLPYQLDFDLDCVDKHINAKGSHGWIHPQPQKYTLASWHRVWERLYIWK